ncbi:MAG: tetratricopeptide repeat protein [Candidatus Omnitrophica bacterium]|nr:tetratricopeptide repeat protein [Candidatus Omnitrophota bacterium]MCM8791429.1 tetratricopeptide repeat protein [Candidatus Omnitrophota bacterium]
MRRICGAVFLIVSIAAFSSLSSEPTFEEWQSLTDEALDHYYYHRYKEAVEVAREALKVAIELFGPEDLKVVGSLDNLASYLAATGEYEEADELYQRAFSILQKKLPADDGYLAIFMDYLAIFYEKIGRVEYAEELRSRARSIRLKKTKQDQK